MGGPKSRSGRVGEEKKIPASDENRTLVILLTELSRLLFTLYTLSKVPHPRPGFLLK
jgi:hypothetical protein